MEITPEVLAALAGALVSFVLEYVPGLRQKWALVDPDWRRLIVAGLTAAIAAGIYLAGCYGYIDGVACTVAGGWGLFITWLGAVGGSQLAFLLAPFKPRNKLDYLGQINKAV